MARDTDNAEQSLTRLYRSEYNSVLAYCIRRVGFDEAEDTAAEVFAVAWRRIDDIDWSTARPWLYGIARNVINNRWRSIYRHRNLTRKLSGMSPDAPTPPDLYAVRREEDTEVLAALRRMSVTDQEVLMLAAWEEMSTPEIGVVLGISDEAASQRLHRAKKRFARLSGMRREGYGIRGVANGKGRG